MKRTPRSNQPATPEAQASKPDMITSPGRRSFIGKAGAAAVAAGVLGKVPTAIAQSSNSNNSASPSTSRIQQCLQLRMNAATRDSQVPQPPHTTNGDES